jgi:protein TonB
MMKKGFFYIGIFITSLYCAKCFGQNAKDSSGILIHYTEYIAEFPGGFEALGNFMFRNLRLPSECNVGGKIVIDFIIDKKGRVVNSKIVKSFCRASDEEVQRVISMLPKWKPALKNGIPVSSHFLFPIILDTE